MNPETAPQLGRPRKIRFQAPKGMHDLLPEDWQYFDKIYEAVKELADFYNFGRIETPIAENLDLFSRGIGEATEVVEKQMYGLKTRGGEALALRPEYTAAVIRAFIEGGMNVLPRPVKLWYWGPCFRREKPQAGRYRQFWQFGFETLGERGSIIDAQIIQISFEILKKLKLKNLLVEINSIGDPRCRSRYRAVLVKYLRSYQAELCADCKKRIKKNPLRVLDCKNEKCQKIISQAPQMLDYLCKECHAHFREMLEFLEELKIPYRLNPHLVRGLDYYTKTVFEIFSQKTQDGSQTALAGGGRYDGLAKILGGKELPACGVAMGIERIANLMKEEGIGPARKKPVEIFLVQLSLLAKRKSLLLLEEFRKVGLPVAETLSKDSFRAQLGRADRLGAKYALILGQKEVLENKIIIRDMEKGVQKTVELEKVVSTIKKKFKD